MRRVIVPLGWSILFAWLVAACDKDRVHPPEVSGAAANPDTTALGDAARYGVGDAPTLDIALLPEDSTQMFERLPPADRAIVEAFYRNYGHSVMDFDNKEELLWLVRQGYPMPEDVLEAAVMSERELQAQYDQGDVMAGYFLLDRKAAAAGKTPPDSTTAWQTASFSQELLARGGPFAGYAYYRYHDQAGDSRSRALAGLLWADWLGDYRAGQELVELTGNAARYRGEEIPNAAAVAFAYQALLGGVRARNPAALTRRIDPLLKYKNGPAGP